MNTYILNRAILNRDALDDNQRKAMFARLGGSAGRAWGKIKQGVSEMGRLPTPEESLNKLQRDARGREALVKSALAMTPVGAGVAIGDILHGRSSTEIALASLGALPFAGGFTDDAARLAGRITLPVAVENPALKAAMREEIVRMFSADDVGGAAKALRPVGEKAVRDALAMDLRRARFLKRLDQNPEYARSLTPSQFKLREAAALRPFAPATEFGYMSKRSIGSLMADLDRQGAAYQTATRGARGYRPGETGALYGNRTIFANAGPMQDDQRRAFFARMKKGVATKWSDDRAGEVGRRASTLLSEAASRANAALNDLGAIRPSSAPNGITAPIRSGVVRQPPTPITGPGAGAEPPQFDPNKNDGKLTKEWKEWAKRQPHAPFSGGPARIPGAEPSSSPQRPGTQPAPARRYERAAGIRAPEDRYGGPAPVRGAPGTIPSARKHDTLSRAISIVRGKL